MTTSTRREPLFHFSLIELFVVVTIIGGIVGWRASVMREREAVHELVTSKGGVYDANDSYHRGPTFRFHYDQGAKVDVTKEDLLRIKAAFPGTVIIVGGRPKSPPPGS